MAFMHVSMHHALLPYAPPPSPLPSFVVDDECYLVHLISPSRNIISTLYFVFVSSHYSAYVSTFLNVLSCSCHTHAL